MGTILWAHVQDNNRFFVVIGHQVVNLGDKSGEMAIGGSNMNTADKDSRCDSNFEQLLSDARQGVDATLGAFFEAQRGFLTQFARTQLDSRMRTKMSGSDVVQESLVRAACEFADFRGDHPQQLQAWLLAILRNQLIDGYRRFTVAEKRRAGRELPDGNNWIDRTSDPGDSPSAIYSAKEDVARLLHVIGELPEQLRQVVELRYVQRLSFNEIAKLQDLPVSTCRRRWFEAIQTIAHQLDGAT